MRRSATSAPTRVGSPGTSSPSHRGEASRKPLALVRLAERHDRLLPAGSPVDQSCDGQSPSGASPRAPGGVDDPEGAIGEAPKAKAPRPSTSGSRRHRPAGAGAGSHPLFVAGASRRGSGVSGGDTSGSGVRESARSGAAVRLPVGVTAPCGSPATHQPAWSRCSRPARSRGTSALGVSDLMLVQELQARHHEVPRDGRRWRITSVDPIEASRSAVELDGAEEPLASSPKRPRQLLGSRERFPAQPRMRSGVCQERVAGRRQPR